MGDAIARCHDQGVAAWDAGRIGEAIEHFRKEVALDPTRRDGRLNLALCTLTTGDLRTGFAHLEKVLPPPRSGALLYDGRMLFNNETVVLFHAEGYGETFQWCRYVSLVARNGGRVVLIVPPSLHRLMKTLPGVTQVFSRDPCRLPLRYYERNLLSLPYVFGTALNTVPASVPYLTGDPAPWQDVLASMPGLKVGICWAGKPGTGNPQMEEMDSVRSMPLLMMFPLLTVPGCSFVSLQLGPASAQLRDLPPGVTVRDVSDRLRDWANTAGLISGLDLVISVDTAIAHLAGALGRPVWLLNRKNTCWRWMRDRIDSPWYPTMRIWRQRPLGDWRIVIADVAQALHLETRNGATGEAAARFTADKVRMATTR